MDKKNIDISWKDRVMKLESDFEGHVRKHPLQSTAIALGAGVLVGASTAWFSKQCN